MYPRVLATDLVHRNIAQSVRVHNLAIGATHGAASIAVYAMAVDVQGAIEARDDDGDDSRDGFSA